MLVLSSCGSCFVSCGKWSLSAACTQLVKRQDLQIVSSNMKQDFRACALSQLSQTSNQSLHRISILPKTRHFFFLHSASVCFPLKLCFGLMRVWRLSLHGLFLWHSNLETVQMSRSFILQFIHSLAFVWWERKAQAHIAFHDLLCQMSTQTNRWEPWWELPDSPNLRLPGLFFNKALMLAERPQCSVSLIVRWEPSGMLMNIQWGFVSRIVLPLSASLSLSSPLKLQGCFTGLLLQGGHLAHCDANSWKFDV